MKSFLTILSVCVLGLLTATSFVNSNESDAAQMDAVQKAAQMFVAAYNANDPARIEREFNSEMREAISSEQFAQFLGDTAAEYGKILKLELSPATANPDGFRLVLEQGTLDLTLSLDTDGKIAGLLLTPVKASQAPKSSRPIVRNQTELGLPFRGSWYVFWGGDEPEQNHHHHVPNQRYAFDFVKVDEKGSSHRGTGSKNEDYYAFDQEIIAPASGVVTDVVDGIRDNVLGEMNEMFVPGNMVVVKHSDQEYSLFAHLKLNSSRVKVGDRVVKGQVLGLCGNSGNSSEPHLHYQLQKTPLFSDESSIKVFFSKVAVQRAGKRTTEATYSPLRGDMVSSD